jgi:guanine deaminase
LKGINSKMDIMKLAIDEARKTMNENKGGPFGAVVTNSNGEVISVASNLVLESHDPTAHAEIMAIRKASQKLNTHDLSGCILYATGYPCPMCLSAIIWSNIKEVYYATDLKDAETIGFRDDYIYNYIKGKNQDILKLTQLGRNEAIKLFQEYHSKEKTIY